MEHMLITIIVLVLFVAIVFALLRWSGIQIPAIIIQIGTWIVIAIVLIMMIRFLWPMLGVG